MVEPSKRTRPARTPFASRAGDEAGLRISAEGSDGVAGGPEQAAISRRVTTSVCAFVLSCFREFVSSCGGEFISTFFSLRAKRFASSIKQIKGQHLHDVKKIIVVEVLMQRDSTLLNRRTHKGKQNPTDDPPGRRGLNFVKSMDLKNQDQDHSGSVIVDNKTEVIVSEHPGQVNTQLHSRQGQRPTPRKMGQASHQHRR